jgi:hypothetical protein
MVQIMTTIMNFEKGSWMDKNEIEFDDNSIVKWNYKDKNLLKIDHIEDLMDKIHVMFKLYSLIELDFNMDKFQFDKEKIQHILKSSKIDFDKKIYMYTKNNSTMNMFKKINSQNKISEPRLVNTFEDVLDEFSEPYPDSLWMVIENVESIKDDPTKDDGYYLEWYYDR